MNKKEKRGALTRLYDDDDMLTLGDLDLSRGLVSSVLAFTPAEVFDNFQVHLATCAREVSVCQDPR
jgi:hypothetical protein